MSPFRAVKNGNLWFRLRSPSSLVSPDFRDVPNALVESLMPVASVANREKKGRHEFKVLIRVLIRLESDVSGQQELGAWTLVMRGMRAESALRNRRVGAIRFLQVLSFRSANFTVDAPSGVGGAHPWPNGLRKALPDYELYFARAW